METIRIGDITIEIQRSRRKTLSLEVTPDGRVIAKAPLLYGTWRIEAFASQKKDWIRRKVSVQKRKQNDYAERHKYLEPFTDEEIKEMQKLARKVIPERVAYYAPIVGVTYNRIAIRGQKSRWGSCSAKGNLNFNYLLMKTNDKVIDYVVIHELCHRKQMNHSKAFWNEVARVMPDYKEQRKWLKTYGGILINRLMLNKEQK